MGKVIESLDPIIDENSRVLILGTIPGPESLSKGEYYASPSNRFWKIIYRVLIGHHEPPSSYSARIGFLVGNRIALWDVLESCEREGSGDSGIRNGKHNDFISLMGMYPNVRRIFFNGGEARKLFKKVNGISPDLIDNNPLPSTSGKNKQALELKVKGWKRVKPFL